MKIAKSSKICVLILALILSLACALSFMNFNVTKADDSFSLSTYFGGSAESIAIDADKDKLVVKTNNEKTFEIKNQLLIDDFATAFTVGDKVSKITLTVTADSYFGEGVRKTESSDLLKVSDINDDTEDNVKEIENVIVIDFTANEFKLNEKAAVAFTPAATGDEYTLGLSVADGNLTVNFASVSDTNTDTYYKIGGKDKTPAELSFKFETTEDDQEIKFSYIDQGASVADGTYKQEFKDENPEKATPRARVTFGGSYIANNKNEVNFINGAEIKASFTEYSVLGKNGGKFSLAKNADADENAVTLSTEDNPDEMKIAASGDVKFDVKQDGKVVETYTAKMYDKGSDTAAPEYKIAADNKEAYDAFIKALYDATRKDYGDNGTHYVKLGDKITVPSFKGLVTDNKTAYEDLTHTMYYRTPSSSTGSTDGWTITLSEAGKYQFYVVFKDKAGNAMDSDKFYKLDDDGEIIAGTYEYEAYVFEFSIEDDAPIIVEPAAVYGKGYLNTEYTFSAFNVEASSYTPSYRLLYSETKNGEYKEIIAKSKIDDEDDYDNEDFTYAEMTGFAYDGKLTFTPVKKGFYKVECTVSSEKVRFEVKETDAVEITEKPSVVKPDTHWLENNVWSVVFLGIGTLCLIGIVVLLFIKPKEEIDDDGDVK